MPKYIIWYQKKLQAKNQKEALKKEQRMKSQFYSLVEEEEKEPQQGASAIGFEIDDPELYD